MVVPTSSGKVDPTSKYPGVSVSADVETREDPFPITLGESDVEMIFEVHNVLLLSNWEKTLLSV